MIIMHAAQSGLNLGRSSGKGDGPDAVDIIPTFRQRMQVVLGEVARERERQIEKWGQTRDYPRGEFADLKAAISASAGPLHLEAQAKAANEDKPSWQMVLLEEVAEALSAGDDHALAEELIQVAAVAVAWVEELIASAAPSPSDA